MNRLLQIFFAIIYSAIILNTQACTKPPFYQYDYVAHALGGYEGNIYNNTEEALINSIDNGYKFLEVDMQLTSDDELVCFHAFSNGTYSKTGIDYSGDIPNYDEFMSWKVQGKYKTIDAGTIIDYMCQYPDLLIDIDLKKSDKGTTHKMISELVKLADNDSEILDRILMQFYGYESYKFIDDVYHFKYYQFIVTQNDLKDINRIVTFCKDNKITGLTINKEYITDKILKKLKSNKIYILSFTTDDEEEAKDLLSRGVNTICTNFLIP